MAASAGAGVPAQAANGARGFGVALSRLARLARLAARPSGSASGEPSRAIVRRPALEPAFVYPPSDPGLPAASAASLVASQSALLARLRGVIGDDDAFDRLHLPAIEALARYVHLLPASAHQHFSAAGGLFRLCLECASFCAEAAAGRIAALAGVVQQRHAMASRWRHAAFLAGLVCELQPALAGMVVCDGHGREWPRFDGALDDWIDEVATTRYHVSWLPAPVGGDPGDPAAQRRVCRAQAIALVGQVFPEASLHWLQEGSPMIVRELYAVSLGDPEACGSPLADLVDVVRREVLRCDAARHPARYGQLRVGHHLEWHLLDALRTRFEQGDWSPGAVGEGMSWWQSGSLCLRWPDAGQAIVADLVGRGMRGIPRASLTLVDCLAAAKLLVPDEQGNWVWPAPVAPGHAAQASSPPAALRFADSAALLPAFSACPNS